MISEMDSNAEILKLLFDRPSEPIFMPRGDPTSVMLNVPDRYIKTRYQAIRKGIRTRLEKQGIKSIAIKNVSIPDLTIPLKLSKRSNLCLFLPEHLEMAGSLVDIFMAERTVEDLISVASYCHERVHPHLFNHALSIAVMHRPDTRDVAIPNFFQSFPAKFLSSEVFAQARSEAAIVPTPERQPIVIEREFTANSREPEQRIAYFREDIGINLHHWHWHLVYPTISRNNIIVQKDRRGELFYYMHQQVLARYNTERFANELSAVIPLDNLREAVPEGYFPKLQVTFATRAWPPRFANIPLSDLDRPADGINFKINTLETWRRNLKEAVQDGFMKNNRGDTVKLTEQDGIDILGNAVEASALSVNSSLYGNYHNMGHVVVALCHDPNDKFLETFAVMGDTSTAMRDPIFYRWHANINDIFVDHKDRLPSYPVSRLIFDNVEVTNMHVNIDNKPDDQFITFWEQSEVDFSRGLDFSPRGPVLVRFTHLQHEPFRYSITVNNSADRSLLGTVRIFMGPRYNERGQVLEFEEKRKLMIELDRFRVVLNQGENVIGRSSSESSVTIPYERTFRDLDTNRPTDSGSLYLFNFCGCGWPQHMLIPRGTTDGMVFDLFVMVSNYENDKIEQDVSGICNDAFSYCGILDKKYPDSQSMGYPFDRVGGNGITTLSDFLTPNMLVQEVTVKLEERTVVRSDPNAGKNFGVVPLSTS